MSVSNVTPTFVGAVANDDKKSLAELIIVARCPENDPLFILNSDKHLHEISITIKARDNKAAILKSIKRALGDLSIPNGEFDAVVILKNTRPNSWSYKTSGKTIDTHFDIMNIALKHIDQAEKNGQMRLSPIPASYAALQVA